MVAGVTDGKVVVDCATLTPERMVDEANRISAKGGSFLEAPVSGSKVTLNINIIFFPSISVFENSRSQQIKDN